MSNPRETRLEREQRKALFQVGVTFRRDNVPYCSLWSSHTQKGWMAGARNAQS